MTTRIYYPLAEAQEISHEFQKQSNLLLEGNSAHHLITVLRRKVGDPVILFDGNNTEYHTIIEKMDKKRIWLTLTKKITINRESPLSIHLMQGISKGDRMDWVVQKSVELGVASITPILTQHAAVKLDPERMLKKVEHWQNIAISACEQCGRNIIPIINPIIHFSDVFSDNRHQLHTLDQSIRWILHPAVSLSGSPSKNSPPHQSVITHAELLIGPEGGFSAEEVSQAQLNNYQPITLGPRILRTETAAVAAISALQTYFEHWIDGFNHE